MGSDLMDERHRTVIRKKVENGQFPNEEAVVEEALRLFLVGGPDNGQSPAGRTTEPQKDGDEDARPWRGVYILQFPEDVHFTKPIDVRPEQLDEWQPQKVPDPVTAQSRRRGFFFS
jgi:hypothetical protein